LVTQAAAKRFEKESALARAQAKEAADADAIEAERCVRALIVLLKHPGPTYIPRYVFCYQLPTWYLHRLSRGLKI